MADDNNAYKLPKSVAVSPDDSPARLDKTKRSVVEGADRKKDPLYESRVDFIHRVLSNNEPPSAFKVKDLEARFTLETSLGKDSKAMQAVKDMVSNSIVSYEQMSTLIAPNDIAQRVGLTEHEAIKPDLLSRVLDLTKTSSVYNNSVLSGIQQFEQTYKGTAIGLPELVKLAERGVKLGDLAKLFENKKASDSLAPSDSQNNSLQLLVEKLVAENASKDQLNAKRVKALDFLNNTFGADSPVVQKILSWKAVLNFSRIYRAS